MRNARLPQAGFTLIEVMVALTVGALVLVTARGILIALGDGARRMAVAGFELDRASNRERLIRSLADRLLVGSDPDLFEGEPDRTRFTSWCEVPEGWLERCSVEFTVASDQGISIILLTTLTGDDRQHFTLMSGFDEAQFIYLADAHNGGSWLQRWGTSITAPLAVGIVLDRDTTVIRIGERG